MNAHVTSSRSDTHLVKCFAIHVKAEAKNNRRGVLKMNAGLIVENFSRRRTTYLARGGAPAVFDSEDAGLFL